MLKYSLKMVVYILVVVIGISILNKGFWASNQYDTEKFQNVPYDIKFCNIGASHSMYSFNYEDWDKENICFNFALHSQRHTYDERILNYYKDHLAEGCKVYIVVTYPMILGEDDYDSKEFISLNERYYSFLPEKLIKNYDKKTAIKMEYAPAAYFGNAGSTIKGVLKWIKNEKVDYNPAWEQTADMIDLKKDADEAFDRHIEKNKIDENGDIVISQNEISAIYKMIDVCKENGFVPVLVTTPFLYEYLDNVEKKAPDFMKTFNSIMIEISTETGAQWFDYSRDLRFKSYDLFMNSDHLNKKGARLFTNLLLEETSTIDTHIGTVYQCGQNIVNLI